MRNFLKDNFGIELSAGAVDRMDPDTLKREMDKAVKAESELINLADAEKRDLTKKEEVVFDQLENRISNLTEALEKPQKRMWLLTVFSRNL
jgi:hypothetical protein